MSWTIDGTTVTVERATLTPRSLSVTFEVSATDISQWRQYERTGDYARRAQYGGGWRLVDDQGRASQTTIAPPADLKPPLDDVTGYVQTYNETQTAPDRYEITIGVERASERRDTYPEATEADLVVPSGETETIAAGERAAYAAADIDGTLDVDGTLALTIDGGPTPWTITTARGTLALEARQVGQITRQGSAAGGSWSLSLGLTDTQAAAIADAAGIPGAVADRPVPDGPDSQTDTSPDNRQTLSVAGPSRASIPSADYLVTGWTLTFRGFAPDRRWAIDLTLQET